MTSLLPLEPYNPFEGDPVLRRAVEREGAGSLEADLLAFGARVGSEEVFQWGTPVLRLDAQSLDTGENSND